MDPFYKGAHIKSPAEVLSLCVGGFHPWTPAETLRAWLLEETVFSMTNPLLESSDSVWTLLLQDPGIPWPKVGAG